MLHFGSYVFLLVCVFETLLVNSFEFARSRRIFDSSITPRFQGALRASSWRRSNFGPDGSSTDSSFTPRFQDASMTSSWRRFNFGPGGLSTDSSFIPRFQEAIRPSSSKESFLGAGGSSAESSMRALLSSRRRNAEFHPEQSTGTRNFSPVHFNGRQSSVLYNGDRASILENVRRHQIIKSSREVFDQTIRSTQPENSARHTAVMFQENRPSSNIASILQRLRSNTRGKSSKEVTKSLVQQRNHPSRHRTVSFLENRRPKQNVDLTLGKTVKTSKEVKDTSLKSVNQKRTFKHPLVSFLDKRRPPPQVNYVSVKSELKEQTVEKTSKEVKKQNTNDREAKMKKIRQLLQLMPENQRYKFLIGLKSAAGSKISAKNSNLRNTKKEYPKVPIQTKLSSNPNIFKTFTPDDTTKTENNKKKTSAEKQPVSNHNTQEDTDESLQRLLLLQKLNSFLRQQLNHDPKHKSEQTKESSKGKIKTNKELTSKPNQHRRTHHTHHVHFTEQPQSNTVQTQYESPQLSLGSTNLNPHRRRLELLARLTSHGLSTSSNFGKLLTKVVNSNVSHANTAKQSTLSNINPYSRDSLKLLDQNDVLNTSKVKESEEKFTWENP